MVVQDIREQFKELLAAQKFVIDKSGVKMVEILGANFEADQPLIFGTPATDWYRREREWYLSQSLNVNDIEPPIPKIWLDVATPEGFVNSNYGWAIFSNENFSQYLNCLKTLKEHSDTRRAIMIYNRPSMQYDYNAGGKSDFMCCQNTAHFIRDGVLTMHVQMRSNCAIYGYKGDFAWFDWVHNTLYNDLLDIYPTLKKGQIFWKAGSLHIYQYHFNLIV